MRTNIEIDDKLLARAKKVAGTKTKKETVDYALRELVRRRQRQSIGDLYGQVRWTGNLDDSRRSRAL